MKSGWAMLLGAGALLGLTGIADNANAAVAHHRTRAHHRAATPSAPTEATDLMISGNNPAKHYDTRHAPANAAEQQTLLTNGNNPAKHYDTRHAPANAAEQQTLLTNGNNPAKMAPRR